MTLAIRVIGTILIDGSDGMALHRERFRTVERRGSPLALANTYKDKAGGFDEILLLDVTATEQKREPDYELIADVVGETFLPVSYGGGITSVEQAVRIVAECGADKVVLRERYYLIGPIAERLGAQAVVVSVNDKVGGVPISASHDAFVAQEFGAGELLCQSIDRDGTLSGYNLGLVGAVSKVVSIPVIASSGCGTPEHAVAAMKAGASAVSAGWMWDATDTTPLDCKKALAFCETCEHSDLHATSETADSEEPVCAGRGTSSICLRCRDAHPFAGFPVRITSQEGQRVG